MKWCNCNSDNYNWRDVACIKGKYYKIDERIYLDEDGHFDIDPIIVDLCVKHNISRDDLIIGAFGKHDIPAEVIEKLLDGKSIGAYCNVCGGEV